MISFAEVPGLEVSPVLLVFIGFAVGVVAGFTGVGGGFMATPALIVLGFPASMAVGTGLATIAGNSVAATMRHRQLGNVDMRLALMMLVGTLSGAECGVRAVNWLKDEGLAEEGILAVSLLVMGLISGYTAWESRRAARRAGKAAGAARETVTSGAARTLQSVRLWPVVYLPHSRVRISIWLLVAIGFLAGFLSGLIGVGGGFVMAPALIYLVGIPSHVTVGTDLLQIVFTGSYGTIRHTMSNNVLIFAAFLMLLGATTGTQIGSTAIRYVTGPAIRLVLALAIGLAALGTAFELANVLAGEVAVLEIAAEVVLFGGMALLTVTVVTLLAMGVRYRQGRNVPEWAKALCCKE